jgi:DNA-binding NarL/FixJ family response regulator
MLRVAIEVSDEVLAARLRRTIEAAGYVLAPSPAQADAVLADADHAVQGATPLVVIGATTGDAAGILSLDADPRRIAASLAAVAAGLRVREPEPGFAAMAEARLRPLLTAREVEVLAGLADGSGNKEIARRLEISLHTVKFHIEAIFRKLGVRSRAEAVARGLQRLDL